MAASGDRPRPVRVGYGPRRVEAALLDALAGVAAEGVDAPGLLATPVRVIVPSSSLRRHLAAALMRATGRAVAGLQIQTLHGVALEILERAGVQPSFGDALFPILVRQQARREAVLAERLDALTDGYAVVAEDVSDLLDAGLTPENAPALLDALEDVAGPRDLVARAGATVRVAARVQQAMADREIGHRSQLMALAREQLELAAADVLPARRIFVHGFAETTGLRSELLETLIRECAAEVYFDEPPDPASAAAEDWSFARRLRDRLAGVAGIAAIDTRDEPAELTTLVAKGAEAEVRAVVERVRALLDTGRSPEGIAVVARDLAQYRAPLRRHFERLGLPFSGVAETGSVGEVWRLTRSLLALLQRRGRATADRWLDVFRRAGTAADLADLRLALRQLGLVRLEDVARHRADAGDVPLPALGEWDDGSEGEGGRARRRSLPAADLAHALTAARAVARRLEALEGAQTLAASIAGLRELLTRELGWDPVSGVCEPVFSALDALASDQPQRFELHSDDFLLLLGRALGAVGVLPIGGKGAGVQILTVMEARARTFDALFVLGLNRDVFPRPIRPDPLLPDLVRRAFANVLPDLPVKATGYDEERYLFAQLVSASPNVTLCWQQSDDAGRERAPSTLVERLKWGGRIGSPEIAPLLQSPGYAGCTTANEQLVLAGLARGREAFAGALPVALDEAYAGLPAPLAGAVPPGAAAARLAVLEAFDPERDRGGVFGPYFGFVGPVRGGADPRRTPMYVTTVERIVRCPWQTFLSRLLHLEAPPDPLQALPSSDARLVGMVVHRALEQIVATALPQPPADLAAALTGPGGVVAWPEGDDLEAELSSAARYVLAGEGVAFRGLEQVLLNQARPFVARARALDAGAEIRTLGAELEGAVERTDRHGRVRRLRFRVDRVDRIGAAPVLTDYKTGKPISTATKADTRARHFLGAVRRGSQLQAYAYALACAAESGSGRFVYLDPDISEDAAAYPVSVASDGFEAAFDDSLAAAFEAWDRGAFFPRLFTETTEETNSACEYCELSLACVQGDTGVRTRVANALAATDEDVLRGLSPSRRALVELWRLREKRDPSAKKSAS